MKKAQLRKIEQPRFRSGSGSDIHIAYCDCSHCDGTGELQDAFLLTGAECPACEGLGYLEPASREAYEVYLNDLYREVIRPMRVPQTSRTASPAAAVNSGQKTYYPAA